MFKEIKKGLGKKGWEKRKYYKEKGTDVYKVGLKKWRKVECLCKYLYRLKEWKANDAVKQAP